MDTVERILRSQGYMPRAIGQESSATGSVKSPVEELIGTLLVLEDGNLYGIVAGSDYFRKVILITDSLKETSLIENVTQKVNGASPEQVVEKCSVLSRQEGIRHLPLIANSRLIGIVSIKDLANAVLANIY